MSLDRTQLKPPTILSPVKITSVGDVLLTHTKNYSFSYYWPRIFTFLYFMMSTVTLAVATFSGLLMRLGPTGCALLQWPRAAQHAHQRWLCRQGGAGPP